MLMKGVNGVDLKNVPVAKPLIKLEKIEVI